jgi:electron transport complex protein RnfG
MTVLVGLAATCGFAIAVVFQATADQIDRNRAELLEQSLVRVLPGAERFQPYRLVDGAVVAGSLTDADWIAGYDAQGLVAVALPVSIMGYQDTIHMLLGYDPEGQRLTGFAVLSSRETPGLGSRIGTDPSFLASLAGLDVTLDGAGLVNPVRLVAAGSSRAAWQVDGITGATVSSRAVVEAVNRSAPRLLEIRRRLSEMAGDG